MHMKCPFLLHRMDEPQTQAWFLSESHRRRVASILSKKYRQDFGILNAGYQLIAKVDTRGAVTPIPPPFAEYHFSLVANKPEAPECVCAGFFDPEVQGPWRERGSPEHHPLCQFDRTSAKVFDISQQKAADRQERKLRGMHERPDDWIRLRKEAKS